MPSRNAKSPSGDAPPGHDPIPANVRQFLDGRFSSVSEVETLVLLIRSARPRSAEEVAHEFVLSPEHSTLLLDALVAAGLVRRTGERYGFDPGSADDRSAAVALAALYPTYRTRIMGIVAGSASG